MRVDANPHSDWSSKPDAIADDHWRDLEAGALLLQARGAAVGVVSTIEGVLSAEPSCRVALADERLATPAFDEWQAAAQALP